MPVPSPGTMGETFDRLAEDPRLRQRSGTSTVLEHPAPPR